MEALLERMAHWPSIIVYIIIGISCLVENIFPPSPSDVFVVTAAFLTHGGEYDSRLIFLSAWIPGILGAWIVYAFAARNGDRFIRSRVGQKLLPPPYLKFLLKEYGRFGLAGLFITRMLPGFRSVVAPFAGINRLPRWSFILAVALASGVWYASLTLIGSQLGNQWETITRILDAVYRTLGVAAILLVALLVVSFMLWRRRHRQG